MLLICQVKKWQHWEDCNDVRVLVLCTLYCALCRVQSTTRYLVIQRSSLRILSTSIGVPVHFNRSYSTASAPYNHTWLYYGTPVQFYSCTVCVQVPITYCTTSILWILRQPSRSHTRLTLWQTVNNITFGVLSVWPQADESCGLYSTVASSVISSLCWLPVASGSWTNPHSTTLKYAVVRSTR